MVGFGLARPICRRGDPARASEAARGCARDDGVMDLAAARGVLGVDAATSWIEVRATYRQLIRRHHPDTAHDLADAGMRTVRTAQITEAFAVIVAAQSATVSLSESTIRDPRPASDTTGDHLGPSFRHPTIAVDDSRVVLLDAPLMDAFLALHEVFSIVGAVSYIDRLSLVLEAIVVPSPGRATSLLTWLDRNPDGATAATICVESLGGHPPADLDTLVARIAELLASPRPPVTSA